MDFLGTEKGDGKEELKKIQINCRYDKTTSNCWDAKKGYNLLALEGDRTKKMEEGALYQFSWITGKRVREAAQASGSHWRGAREKWGILLRLWGGRERTKT